MAATVLTSTLYLFKFIGETTTTSKDHTTTHMPTTTEFDACKNNPCVNGGNCTDVDDVAVCECPDNTSGDNCEV